jgi:hypothetical protein
VWYQRPLINPPTKAPTTALTITGDHPIRVHHFFTCNRKGHVETLQDLTVLPMEFFCRCKTHIPSVIILLMESKTEMIRR